MIPFGEVSHVFQGVLMMLFLVALIVQMACTLFSLSYKMRNAYKIGGTVSMVFSASLLYFLLYSMQTPDLKPASWFSPFFTSLPTFVVLLMFLLSLLMALFFSFSIRRYMRSHITSNSVKESMDQIPVCLCFFNEDGQVLLSNNAMQHIAEEKEGHGVLHGKEFWNDIRSENTEKDSPEKPIIRTRDNHVLSFVLRPVALSVSHVEEIIAYDITQEYVLHERLQLKNVKSQDMNEYLRECIRKNRLLAAEREALDVRMRIHNAIGGLLLSAKRWYETGTEEEYDALLANFKENALLLGVDQGPVPGFEDLRQCAKTVGVDINLLGPLPKDEKVCAIFLSAIRECVTNTVKHANGNEVQVSLMENETTYEISCTNNGKQPDAPIEEKGGLLSLRRLVERHAGSMKTACDPRFKLVITIGKGR